MPPEPVTPHSLPIPPKAPIRGECCERGCENCVWVFYYEALRRYDAAVVACVKAAGTRRSD